MSKFDRFAQNTLVASFLIAVLVIAGLANDSVSIGRFAVLSLQVILALVIEYAVLALIKKLALYLLHK